MWKSAFALVTLALVGSSGAHPSSAAPYLPSDEAQVLETGLPNADPRVRQIRQLSNEFAQRRQDLDLAMRLAARQLAMGVAEADPRFVGYARGTLAPWWHNEQAAPALRILRARILQAQHEFAPAADELRGALRDAPGSPDALLLLAAVHEVTGTLDEARQACVQFEQVHPGLAAVACHASIDSLTGDSSRSAQRLAEAVDHLPTTDRAQLRWALTVLAEIAIQQGDSQAGTYLKEALALDARDVYALTVYADFLLEQGQSEQVLRLLAGFERVDALYLRIALAAQALGDPRFPKYRDDLAARFAAARRQGDTLHLRDASRFALEILHDNSAALDFARQNWATHKSPADLRALLAAAVACHDSDAAAQGRAWIAKTHLEDRKSEELLRQLDRSAPS